VVLDGWPVIREIVEAVEAQETLIDSPAQHIAVGGCLGSLHTCHSAKLESSILRNPRPVCGARAHCEVRGGGGGGEGEGERLYLLSMGAWACCALHGLQAAE
jgi:hypothetical protein